MSDDALSEPDRVTVDIITTTPDPMWLEMKLGRAARDPLIQSQGFVIEDNQQHAEELINTTASKLDVSGQVQTRRFAANGISGT